MLEIAVLGLLSESPLHGYELRKRLAGLLGTFRQFSYGSLYPTLRKLSEAGWITEETPTELTAPATRSRRGKRVYQLTAEGKEHFAQLLGDVSPDAYGEEEFGARLAFFAQTRSEIRLQVLEGRRRRVEEQREGMASSIARTRGRLDRYTLKLQEHGLESVDREVRWLTELIDGEHSRGIDGEHSRGIDGEHSRGIDGEHSRGIDGEHSRGIDGEPKGATTNRTAEGSPSPIRRDRP